MTYNDYLIKTTETMKIRSSNYRMTQNDIIYLVNNVFTEIATEVILKFNKQEVLMSADQKEYDLDSLYTPSGNEILLDVMSIRDSNGLEISELFNEVSPNVFQYKDFVHDDTVELFMDMYDAETITFWRQEIPDIETISSKIQTIIFNALVEGILWYTHDNIPNPVSSNSPQGETNMYYQRYYKARENIKNLLPQRM